MGLSFSGFMPELWRSVDERVRAVSYGTFTFPSTVATAPGSADSRAVSLYYMQRSIPFPGVLLGIMGAATNAAVPPTLRRARFAIYGSTVNGGPSTTLFYDSGPVQAAWSPRNPATGSANRLVQVLAALPPRIEAAGLYWLALALEHTYTGETALQINSGDVGQYRWDISGSSMQGDVTRANTTNIASAGFPGVPSADGTGYTNNAVMPNLALLMSQGA
jgi:hypothetical protein